MRLLPLSVVPCFQTDQVFGVVALVGARPNSTSAVAMPDPLTSAVAQVTGMVWPVANVVVGVAIVAVGAVVSTRTTVSPR